MIEYFVKNLVFFALAAVTFLLIRLTLNRTKLNGKSDGKTLRYPLGYRLAPLITLGFFAVVVFLYFIFGAKNWLYVVAAAVVAAVGLCVSLCFSLWRVVIKDESFVFRSCLGTSVEYFYKDLQQKNEPSGAKWFFVCDGQKVFTMPFFVRGGNKLLSAYDNYYNRQPKA